MEVIKKTYIKYNFIKEWYTNNEFPRFCADVNGDGRADLVAFGDKGVYVALSNGEGFNEPSFELNDFGKSNGFSSFDEFPRLVGNVLGNKKASLIAFNSNLFNFFFIFFYLKMIKLGAPNHYIKYYIKTSKKKINIILNKNLYKFIKLKGNFQF